MHRLSFGLLVLFLLGTIAESQKGKLYRKSIKGGYSEIRETCEAPCLNGGRCFKERCVCPPGFRGSACQYTVELCDPRRALGFIGESQCNHTSRISTCLLNCAGGFRYASLPPTDVYTCSVYGKWSPALPPRCIRDRERGQRRASSAFPKRSSGTCAIWGRGHYRTFDGSMYSFRSQCRHLLAHDCKGDLFSIHVNDLNCTEVSCLRSVEVYVEGQKYGFELTPTPRVVFGDSSFPLPTTLEGLRVKYVAGRVLISSDLGFSITWDGEGLVEVSVIDELKGNMCGLCGQYDGDPSNDFINKHGRQVTSRKAFLESWEMNELGEKCEDVFYDPSIRHKSEEITAEARKLCSKVETSEFDGCHQVADPIPYERICIDDFEACQSASNGTCMCDTLAEYFRECQRLGGRLERPWRDPAFCAAQCPPGMVYSQCGASCQKTCRDPEPVCGPEACMEGCQCAEGTYFHNGNCLPMEDCPCLLHGKEYTTGARVEQECNACECKAGEWQCTTQQCPSRCTATGNPLYSTFDGKAYEFSGKCPYYLLKSDNFTVVQETGHCASGLPLDSSTTGLRDCFKIVTVTAGDDVVILKRGEVIVNGNEVMLPFSDGRVTAYLASSEFIKVHFPNGVILVWDRGSRLYVDSPEGLSGHFRGLCGTNNLNQKDDFETEAGDVEVEVASFASKWKAHDACEEAEDVQSHPCYLVPHRVPETKALCHSLKGDVFERCHSVVDPEPYYKMCVHRTCSCKGDVPHCVCPAFAEYGAECARKGVAVNWREHFAACSVECPEDQTWNECNRQRSCYEVSMGLSGKTCVEGCACTVGYLKEGVCVLMDKCPCLYKNKELPPGGFLRKRGELCECSTGQLQCFKPGTDMLPDVNSSLSLLNAERSITCPDDDSTEYTPCLESCPRTCENLNTAPTCDTEICQPGCRCKAGFVVDPRTGNCILEGDCGCKHGGRMYDAGSVIRRDCNKCTCRSGRWECQEKDCPGVCTAWGEAHFNTFDGRIFDFRGDCEYVMIKGRLNDTAKIEVDVQSIPCVSGNTVCRRVAKVVLGEEIVTLGLTKKLPSVKYGINYVIRETTLQVTLYSPLGIIVEWDKGTRVAVQAEPIWAGRVKGLCGNYNGNQLDDFQTPSGGLSEGDARVFGDSWNVQEHCRDTEAQVDFCDEHPHRATWAAQKCEVLYSDLFQPCHSEVEVEPYYDRCVQDVCNCDSGGDCECLCTNVAAYAHECSAQGIPIRWRSQELCPIQCDGECSEYHACVPACPPKTCEMMATSSQIRELCDEETCFEGCLPKPCPPGMVYNNERELKCIPESQCEVPCKEINGRLYYEGDRILDETIAEPCESCFCQHNAIVCTGHPCPTPTPPLEVECSQTGWTPWYSALAKASGRFALLGDAQFVEWYMQYCGQRNVADIQCRVQGTEQDASDGGQKVTCQLPRGLACYNRDQTDGACLGYQVRLLCECDVTTPVVSTTPTVPTTTAAPTTTSAPTTLTLITKQPPPLEERARTGGETTPVPQTTTEPVIHLAPTPPQCVSGWTEFINIDRPDTGEGDVETVEDIMRKRDFCSGGLISDIDCKANVNGELVDYQTTGDFGVKCSRSTGLLCVNWLQPRGKTCHDYSVRFYCACEEVPPVPTELPATSPPPTTTTQPTTTTTTVPPATAAETTGPPVQLCEPGWSVFFDIDKPTTGAGDFEILENMHQLPCGLDMIEDIECKAVSNEADELLDWEETGDNVTCLASKGLTCFNHDQSEGRMCHNYKIRVYCSCGAPTTTPPPTTTQAAGETTPLEETPFFPWHGVTPPETTTSTTTPSTPGTTTPQFVAPETTTHPTVGAETTTPLVVASEGTTVPPTTPEVTTTTSPAVVTETTTTPLAVSEGTTVPPTTPKVTTTTSPVVVTETTTPLIVIEGRTLPPTTPEATSTSPVVTETTTPLIVSEGTTSSPATPEATTVLRTTTFPSVVTEGTSTVYVPPEETKPPPPPFVTVPEGTTTPPPLTVTSVVTYPEVASSTVQTTTTTPEVTTVPSVCPPGQVYSDCAYRCDQTCSAFLHLLVQETKCGGPDVCIAGCRPEFQCDPPLVWHDYATCIAVEECSCALGDQLLGPYQIVDSGCYRCICNNNTVSCEGVPGCKALPPESQERGPETTTPLPVTPELPPITPPVQPVCVSGWTPWFNTHSPDEYGDVESLEAIRAAGHPVCGEQYLSSVQCKPALEDDTQEEDQHIVCDVHKGMVCENAAMASGRCQDYMVRFHCDCAGVTVPPLTSTEAVVETSVFPEELTTPPITTTVAAPTEVHPPERCSKYVYLVNGPTPLPASRLSASSSAGVTSSPDHGRLGSVTTSTSMGAWIPRRQGLGEFVEVDLGGVIPVYGVATQGRDRTNHWVTRYRVLVSEDGDKFFYLHDKDGEPKEFLGNHDAVGVMRHVFMRPVRARFVRIEPTAWNTIIALRFDILGCIGQGPGHRPPIRTTPTPPTTTPAANVATTVLCPELPDVLHQHCPQCPADTFCDGLACVSAVDCPCFQDSQLFRANQIVQTSTCDVCVCTLYGHSECTKKECSCSTGQRPSLDQNCKCKCEYCPMGQMLCPTSQECIDEKKWCNGVKDCPDDETDCPAATPAMQPCPRPQKPSCPAGHYARMVRKSRCPEYICVPGGEVEEDVCALLMNAGTCSLAGNTIRTFDGQEFRYEVCDHVLLQDREQKRFSVTVHKQCMSSGGCIKSLSIKADEVFVKLGPSLSDVAVNGMIVHSEHLDTVSRRLKEVHLSVNGKRLLFRSLKHNFQVALDGRQDVKIGLSECLTDRTNGMCGPFNYNPSDDFQMPDGRLAPNGQVSGDSWATTLASNCQPSTCPQDVRHHAHTTCRKIKDPSLNLCLQSISVSTAMEVCEDFMCECIARSGMENAKHCSCEAIEEFVATCDPGTRESIGSDWRLAFGCTPECPKGTEWRDCGPACEKTCDNLHEKPKECPEECVPGCFCPPGLVRRGNDCVPPNLCHDCVCRGHGDPNYITFDGHYYDFQGSCSYVLAQHVSSDDALNFQVVGINVECPEEPHTTCTDGVIITYKNHYVKVAKGQPVSIDDHELQERDFPWNKFGFNVTWVPGRSSSVSVPAIDLVVRYFELNYGFSIELPSFTYFNKTEGLCGVCNFDSSDDLLSRHGTVTDDVPAFAYSWLLEGTPEICNVRPTTKRHVPPEICEFQRNACDLYVDPDQYQKACMNDAGYSHNLTASVCRSKLQFAATCCSEGGISIHEWLKESGCPSDCPMNMELRCGSDCVKTCANYKNVDEEVCAASPSYGCFCKESFVLKEGRCVKPRDCEACDDEGHLVGDKWSTGPCETCECTDNLKVRCTSTLCPPPPTCRSDEQLRHYPKKGGACCDDYECEPKSRKHCRPTEPAKCAPGAVSKLQIGTDGCPSYVCECDIEQCPPMQWPTNVEPGLEPFVESHGCCKAVALRCNVQKCPEVPRCPPEMELQNLPGECCTTYKCVPKNKCAYTHRYKVVNGMQVQLHPDQQYLRMYPAGSAWMDGLCTNCSCSEHQSQFQHSCNVEVCPSYQQDSEDYEYAVDTESSSGKCCAKQRRMACRGGGHTHPIGTQWHLPGEENCRTYRCERSPSTGEALKITLTQICNVTCPPSSKYEPPLPESNDCCGKCVPQLCEENGNLYQVGETWPSTSIPCFKVECAASVNGSVKKYKMDECPPLPPNCPRSNIVRDEKGCCQTCKITPGACQPQTISLDMSTQYFSLFDPTHGHCENTESIPDLAECRGQCYSRTKYRSSTDDFESICRCCTIKNYATRKVALTCEDGTKVMKQYKNPTECTCTACGEQPKPTKDIPEPVYVR